MVINAQENLPHVSRQNDPYDQIDPFIPYGRLPHWKKNKVKRLDPNQFEVIVCKPSEKPFKQSGRYGIGLGY